MADKVTRRGLFGLMGALAVAVAVPPGAVAAAAPSVTTPHSEGLASGADGLVSTGTIVSSADSLLAITGVASASWAHTHNIAMNPFAVATTTAGAPHSHGTLSLGVPPGMLAMRLGTGPLPAGWIARPDLGGQFIQKTGA